ncbi:hypothetical protein LJR030_005308 [Rhizobium sp. LjRoot30]|uniref:hypothetical protein n=1 Tax=Rhizobium sp. LjRoot30 TaxID=3342320 RepID=UPI003ECD3D72
MLGIAPAAHALTWMMGWSLEENVVVIDANKSLVELDGWVHESKNLGAGGLIGRVERCLTTALCSLDIHDLISLLGQRMSEEIIVRYAMQMVRENRDVLKESVNPIDLLVHHVHPDFYRQMPALCDEVVAFFYEIDPYVPEGDIDSVIFFLELYTGDRSPKLGFLGERLD